MRFRALLAIAVAVMAWSGPASGDSEAPSIFDRDAAIAYSQAAIGREPANYAFRTSLGERRMLADYRGKPLVVNFVYTGCIYSCPLVVEALYGAVEVANETIGDGRYRVVTIGFDTRDDTPARMRAYAKSHGIDLPNWEFLSTNETTAKSLAEELGFLFMESPAGFEHVAQTTVLDAEGRIYQHVYGANFEPPALVEPLKNLSMARPAGPPSVADLVDRVRLFCTSYDPSSGRYRFDYSIFFALVIGGMTLVGLSIFLVRTGFRIYRDRPTSKEQNWIGS